MLPVWPGCSPAHGTQILMLVQMNAANSFHRLLSRLINPPPQSMNLEGCRASSSGPSHIYSGAARHWACHNLHYLSATGTAGSRGADAACSGPRLGGAVDHLPLQNLCSCICSTRGWHSIVYVNVLGVCYANGVDATFPITRQSSWPILKRDTY
jgi:hypothetical protein